MTRNLMCKIMQISVSNISNKILIHNKQAIKLSKNVHVIKNRFHQNGLCTTGKQQTAILNLPLKSMTMRALWHKETFFYWNCLELCNKMLLQSKCKHQNYLCWSVCHFFIDKFTVHLKYIAKCPLHLWSYLTTE